MTKFSEVIDLASTSGRPVAFCTFPQYKIRLQKGGRQNTVKWQAQISIKMSILEK
jgi:hypothetical protein